MKQLYIVTGANGHLGNTIVKQLVARGERVRCLVLPQDNLNSLQGVDCQIVYGDVTAKNSLEPLFRADPDTQINVIHCAAVISIASGYDKRVYEVNVNGVKNIADMALEKGVRKFVHVSSVHAIPEGKKGSVIKEINRFDKDAVKGLYAKTKAEASQYILEKAAQGLNACIVHPSGILGPNDYGHGHLTQMVIDYLDGRLTACVKGGYDFVDVRDVAQGIIDAVENGEKGQCYLLTGHYMAVRDMLNIVSDISGKKKIKVMLPMWLAKLTAPLAELWYKMRRQPPLFTRYSLYTLGVNSNFDNSKARLRLGFNPRPLKDTLKDTVAWLKDHNRLKTFGKKKLRKKVSDKT